MDFPVPKAAKLKLGYEWSSAVRIGKGSYGTVYKVKVKNSPSNDIDGQYVAVKVFDLSKFDNKNTVIHDEIAPLRFLQEHERHVNIVNFIASSIESKYAYLVFDYVPHDLMGLLNDPNFQFTIPVVKNIFFQLLNALDYLHSMGYMHRDIKPANIFISRQGVLKLGDFSLCTKILPRKKRDHVVVSSWYRAPELFFGESFYGPSVDIWAAGCILGELLNRTRGYLGIPSLFNDSQEVNVVKKIFSLCGTPPKDLTSYYANLPNWKKFQPRNDQPRVLPSIFGDYGVKTLQLIDSMLSLNPKFRPTTMQLLGHPWFSASPSSVTFLRVPQDRVCNECETMNRIKLSRKRKAEDNCKLLKRRKLNNDPKNPSSFSSQVETNSSVTTRFYKDGKFICSASIEDLGCPIRTDQLSFEIRHSLTKEQLDSWKGRLKRKPKECVFSSDSNNSHFAKLMEYITPGKYSLYTKSKPYEGKEMMLFLIPNAEKKSMKGIYLAKRSTSKAVRQQ